MKKKQKEFPKGFLLKITKSFLIALTVILTGFSLVLLGKELLFNNTARSSSPIGTDSPTSPNGAVRSLSSKIGPSRKIDKSKLNLFLQQLPEDFPFYHTAQIMLDCGGYVENISFEKKTNNRGDEVALTITVKPLDSPFQTFQKEFTRQDLEKLEIYLREGGQSQILKLEDIKKGDLINIVEVINLLGQSERKDLLIFEIERRS